MMKKLVNKVFRKFKRYRLFINPRIYRPSSKPFISGDSFRKISDHIFDETKTLKVGKVKTNDLVFVRNDLLKYFFENYHIKIKNPYILISHNADEPIDESYQKYLDSKIVHWFCFKLNFPMSKKVTPIPAGLENMRYRKNGIIRNFLKVQKIKESKDKIMSSFNENTNYLERNKLKNISANHEAIIQKNYDSPLEYLLALNKFQYNLSPDGNGGESHRIWESLIFNVTPIVSRNPMNENFYNMGVPLIMLDNWNDLSDLTLQDINKLNLINKNKDYKKYSTFKYWNSLIISKKLTVSQLVNQE